MFIQVEFLFKNLLIKNALRDTFIFFSYKNVPNESCLLFNLGNLVVNKHDIPNEYPVLRT